MAKAKQKTSKTNFESAYFLKLTLYLILGSLWVRIGNGSWELPLPIGLMVGLLLARNDRFKIDRKIEYAVLLVAMFVGFWTPLGLYIHL